VISALCVALSIDATHAEKPGPSEQGAQVSVKTVRDKSIGTGVTLYL
jgi:hypothetical protein